MPLIGLNYLFILNLLTDEFSQICVRFIKQMKQISRNLPEAIVKVHTHLEITTRCVQHTLIDIIIASCAVETRLANALVHSWPWLDTEGAVLARVAGAFVVIDLAVSSRESLNVTQILRDGC